jgi:plasmid maintenance system killer protein
LEVSFDDPGLAEMCASEKELRKKCGMVRAKKIQQRLKDLRAVQSLADMRLMPGRCHELRENLAGRLSLDLDHPYRLLFRPAEDTEPGPGGGLDWTKITAVVVLSVTNTHE